MEEKARSDGGRKKNITLMDHDIEHGLCLWVTDMWNKNIFLIDKQVQEKARRLQLLFGNPGRKYGSLFSNGWLQLFKERIKFKSHRTHVPIFLALVAQHEEDFVFNADECSLFYRCPPSVTIGPAPLRGHKKDKERVNFLICSDANGKVRLPSFVVGRSLRPRSFGRGVGGNWASTTQPARMRGWRALFFWLASPCRPLRRNYFTKKSSIFMRQCILPRFYRRHPSTITYHHQISAKTINVYLTTSWLKLYGLYQT